MDWRDEGRAGPTEVRRVDEPEGREAAAELRGHPDPVDELLGDEHDGWQPVRRRSTPPPER